MRITVINGTGQIDYMFGLVSGLSNNKNDQIDVIDVDIAVELFRRFENVHYYPVFKYNSRNYSFYKKVVHLLKYYFFLINYILSHKKRIIHFQWLDRNRFLDRILIPAIASIKGHKIIYTVHNINSGKRDGRDSWYNRLSLSIIYKLAHRLIVHTPLSKQELCADFGIRQSKVFIIKHGINNRVMLQGLSTDQARTKLTINNNEKVVLFFGNIDHYKGLDILIDSLNFLPETIIRDFRLVIAGNSKSTEYGRFISEKVNNSAHKQKILLQMSFIPDNDIELYFQGADCIVLPYRNIYQSGVIFMAYTFGLPMILSDIGNFRDDILVGTTGLLIKKNTPEEIGVTITQFFDSDMYKRQPEYRKKIREWGFKNYSWDTIGIETRKLYTSVL
jgi:glycosyltransferase involved in cell wall biosynthesis